jgi:hypothetical protein
MPRSSLRQVLMLLLLLLPPPPHTWVCHTSCSHRGKYTMLERDYSDSVDAAARTRADGDCKVVECCLPPPVQALLKTICSIAMMKSTMADIGALITHASACRPPPPLPRNHSSPITSLQVTIL